MSVRTDREREALWRWYRIAYYPEVVRCPVCGKEFQFTTEWIWRTRGQVYCSRGCIKVAERDGERKRMRDRSEPNVIVRHIERRKVGAGKYKVLKSKQGAEV